MTSKEILINSLNFKPVPRIPVTILSGITWAIRRAGLSAHDMLRLPDNGAGLLVDAVRDIGSDMVFGGRTIPYVIIEAMGGETYTKKVGCATDIIRRPLNELSDIRALDIDRVTEAMYADEDYVLMTEQTKKIKALVGDEMPIAVGGFGPFSMASQMIGVDKLLESLYDEDAEDDLAALMKFATEIVYRFTEPFVGAGGDLVYIADPVSSGDLISPATYEEFALPALRELTARLKKICPYFLFHICGNTTKRIEPLKTSGIDVFSVDSIDMDEAFTLADGKIALMGNLSPAGILAAKTPEEIYALSTALCRRAGLGGGFWLGPGCDLAPDTPLENLQAMTRAAHDFRG